MQIKWTFFIRTEIVRPSQIANQRFSIPSKSTLNAFSWRVVKRFRQLLCRCVCVNVINTQWSDVKRQNKCFNKWAHKKTSILYTLALGLIHSFLFVLKLWSCLPSRIQSQRNKMIRILDAFGQHWKQIHSKRVPLKRIRVNEVPSAERRAQFIVYHCWSLDLVTNFIVSSFKHTCHSSRMIWFFSIVIHSIEF